ncbi:MAG TPA: PfkB family carbohydrate kinase [Solirubrobacteraceae bacterium]
MSRSFDYTTVGHVTVDVMPDGSSRPGGSAFYAALQAARLGMRTLIVTKGAVGEIERLVEPWLGELDLRVLPAARTTTLVTSGRGAARTQQVLAWAGAIGEEVALDTRILHLAPVARETPREWRGRAGFVGITPQGLVRRWSREDGGVVVHAPLDPALLPARGDAFVLSETERESCEALIAGHRGAVVAITAGAEPTTLRLADGELVRVVVPAIERPRDDVGAGDVFAAAFFVALGEGRSPQSAAAFANAAGAVRIGGIGAEAIGDRTAIEARRRSAA